jgi:hypothetical protein
MFDMINRDYPYLKTTRKHHAMRGGGQVFGNAQELAEAGELDEAWKIVDEYLTYVDPDDPAALTVAQQIFFKTRKNTTAYQFAKRASEVDPTIATAGRTSACCRNSCTGSTMRRTRSARRLNTPSGRARRVRLPQLGLHADQQGRLRRCRADGPPCAEVQARTSVKAKANLGHGVSRI